MIQIRIWIGNFGARPCCCCFPGACRTRLPSSHIADTSLCLCWSGPLIGYRSTCTTERCCNTHMQTTLNVEVSETYWSHESTVVLPLLLFKHPYNICAGQTLLNLTIFIKKILSTSASTNKFIVKIDLTTYLIILIMYHRYYCFFIYIRSKLRTFNFSKIRMNF